LQGLSVKIDRTDCLASLILRHSDIKLLEKEIYGETEAEDLRDAVNSILDSNNSPLASNLPNQLGFLSLDGG